MHHRDRAETQGLVSYTAYSNALFRNSRLWVRVPTLGMDICVVPVPAELYSSLFDCVFSTE
jgi:hypothetical protein